jgi:uncharacterized protein (TIGR03083 family)
MDPWEERKATIDTGVIYEQTRARFVHTVRTVQAHEAATPVQATPGWAVRDVLAHVVGLAADLNAQRFPDGDDIAGATWTTRQVEARRATSIADIVDEWDREAPTFEDGLRLFGYEEGSHFVADLHAHHQDVRGALGLSHDDDPLAVAVSLDHYLGFIDTMLRTSKWGTLAVTAAGEQRTLGEGGPHHAHVSGSGFEVLRTFSARRSERQVRRMSWEGDLDSLLTMLGELFSGSGYSLPELDLAE